MANVLTGYAILEHTKNHIHIELSVPHQVVSSAVLNGGMVQANHIVNMKVPKDSPCPELPELTLSRYCAVSGWSGTAVGMMTAASMDSFRMTKKSEQGIEIAVLVTSGLSNPRRAGDYAEHRQMASHYKDVGTINIIVITSASLTGSALIEALLITTEAKSAALQEAGIMSPVSNKLATGTGTDSVAVVSGPGPGDVKYCGKHVLFGELLGSSVIAAVSSSIQWTIENKTHKIRQSR
ncbi:MAG: adenosylcobinamide amidohydrolase [Desulfobacterales bacterium]